VKEVLNELQAHYQLALVSDAQPCFALPEIRAVGLENYFNPVIISSYYGFRKPDSRLFNKALDKMGISRSEVIAIGNDMFRDIYGAQLLDIGTIFFDSNQGAKTYENVVPAYRAQQFEDILTGIAQLAQH
jgi:putative hydrolase of the HAD superfamily